MVLVHITGQNLSLVRLPVDTGVNILRHCEKFGNGARSSSFEVDDGQQETAFRWNILKEELCVEEVENHACRAISSANRHAGNRAVA
jgi:hypothetical protein